ncbi:MAG: M56 family metallopeptidase [Acidobacteria bacterium]|jgi:beta-lactamase regulating signal transducer with metallopeptidase domain|nr:M56 family metallopeptidase [Acidobacteriota bacterium]
MSLTVLGWAVIHSLWQCTLLAGVAALILSILPDSRARVRHLVAFAGLVAMVALPLATALASADPMGESIRRPVMLAIDDAVGLPAVVEVRAFVVPAAAALWLGGLILYAVKIGREWRRAQQLQRLDLDEAGEPLESVVAELRSQLSLRTSVDVRRSRRATVPMVLGWIRPTILLPVGTAASLAPRQLRAILAHELAHVRRRDYLANLIQMAAETVLFHHPAAHWISRRIRTEREYCCDDVAVGVGSDPADYARALAALDDARDDCRLAVAAASGTLLDRIQRIVGHPRPMLTPMRGIAVLATASLVAAIMIALTAVVPPDLPLDVKMRSRMPGPASGGPPPADAVSLPRTPQR